MQLYMPFAPVNLDIAMDQINDDLSRIHNWCRANCLVLNPSKSKVMLLGSKNNLLKLTDVPLNIYIDNKPIEQVMVARNLGVTFDGRLNFDHHITECARNCFYRLKLLYRVRPYLTEALRIRLCNSVILSKFNYCDIVYGPCLLARTANLIQRVQNACARFCFNIPARAHVTPFLNCANILKMEARRRVHLATLLFGITNTGNPGYLYNKLSWAQDCRHHSKRSSTFVFRTPKFRTMAFRGSFRFAASRCWNDLPPPLRDLKSTYSFKKRVNQYLLQVQKNTWN
jgi:hypothetical protein